MNKYKHIITGTSKLHFYFGCLPPPISRPCFCLILYTVINFPYMLTVRLFLLFMKLGYFFFFGGGGAAGGHFQIFPHLYIRSSPRVQPLAASTIVYSSIRYPELVSVYSKTMMAFEKIFVWLYTSLNSVYTVNNIILFPCTPCISGGYKFISSCLYFKRKDVFLKTNRKQCHLKAFCFSDIKHTISISLLYILKLFKLC